MSSVIFEVVSFNQKKKKKKFKLSEEREENMLFSFGKARTCFSLLTRSILFTCKLWRKSMVKNKQFQRKGPHPTLLSLASIWRQFICIFNSDSNYWDIYFNFRWSNFTNFVNFIDNFFYPPYKNKTNYFHN